MRQYTNQERRLAATPVRGEYSLIVALEPCPFTVFGPSIASRFDIPKTHWDRDPSGAADAASAEFGCDWLVVAPSMLEFLDLAAKAGKRPPASLAPHAAVLYGEAPWIDLPTGETIFRVDGYFGSILVEISEDGNVSTLAIDWEGQGWGSPQGNPYFLVGSVKLTKPCRLPGALRPRMKLASHYKSLPKAEMEETLFADHRDLVNPSFDATHRLVIGADDPSFAKDPGVPADGWTKGSRKDVCSALKDVAHAFIHDARWPLTATVDPWDGGLERPYRGIATFWDDGDPAAEEAPAFSWGGSIDAGGRMAEAVIRSLYDEHIRLPTSYDPASGNILSTLRGMWIPSDTSFCFSIERPSAHERLEAAARLQDTHPHVFMPQAQAA